MWECRLKCSEVTSMTSFKRPPILRFSGDRHLFPKAQVPQQWQAEHQEFSLVHLWKLDNPGEVKGIVEVLPPTRKLARLLRALAFSPSIQKYFWGLNKVFMQHFIISCSCVGHRVQNQDPLNCPFLCISELRIPSSPKEKRLLLRQILVLDLYRSDVYTFMPLYSLLLQA